MRISLNKLILPFTILISLIISYPTSAFSMGSKPKIEQKTLTVGLVTWPGFGPLFIAEEKGYFKEKNLKIDVKIIEDEAARRSAFANGQLDIAANTVDTLASGAPQGINGVIFLKTDISFGADGIVSKKEVNSVAELIGKRIAYPKGLPSHYFLYRVLLQEGLKLSDIVSIYMEASDAGAAFSAGKIDAAVTWEPWLSQSAESGKVLATTRDLPGFIIDVLMVSPIALRNKKEALSAFTECWFKGLDFLIKNKKESTEIIANSLKLPAEDTTFFLTLVKFAKFKDNLSFFGINNSNNICAETFKTASDLWLKEGIINSTVNATDYCSGEFIKSYKP